MGNRRTDAELRAMHAEKQAALTERMAAKADPRIAHYRKLSNALYVAHSEKGTVLFEVQGGQVVLDAAAALDRAGNLLVRQWAEKEAQGQA